MRAYCDRRATPQWAKIGLPRRGCAVKARRSVATLARATSPRCTPFLPANLHSAITVGLPNREGL